MVWKLVLSGVIGYLLGSISFAVIMSRLFKKQDVRDMGSGNAGATNVARVFGMGTGVATLVCDGVKTAASMLLGRLAGGEYGFLIAGAACLLGHCFPVFFGFRGGKGVTVGAVMGLMLSWQLFVLLCVVFFAVFFISRKVSLCSISCAVAFPLLQLALGERDLWRLLLGVFTMLCVVLMHRGNIKRLLTGTEANFKPGGKRDGKK